MRSVFENIEKYLVAFAIGYVLAMAQQTIMTTKKKVREIHGEIATVEMSQMQ